MCKEDAATAVATAFADPDFDAVAAETHLEIHLVAQWEWDQMVQEAGEDQSLNLAKMEHLKAISSHHKTNSYSTHFRY